MAARWEGCATVGEFLTSVVLKELWTVQLSRNLAAGTAFDPQHARELLEQRAPELAADILETARGWISSAGEITPSSLLPDMNFFPSNPQDAEGITVAQRKLLLDSLEIILDVFEEPDPKAAGPLFSQSSLACIASQVATMLERFTLLQPQVQGPGTHGDAHLDLASWQRICSRRKKQPPTSKAELVEELQQCRQRIFGLEKELETQAKNAESYAGHKKHEHEKAVSRLLEVNRALELKLKQRTQECKEVGLSVADFEARMSHQRWLVEEQAAKAKRLEEELARSTRLHSDILVREKEYGKRVLRLHMQEFESSCRNDQRMRRLSGVMDAHTGEMLTSSRLPDSEARQDDQGEDQAQQAPGARAGRRLKTEANLSRMAEETLKKLEADLDEMFEDRQRRFNEIVRKREESLEKRKKADQECSEQVKKEMLSAQRGRRGHRKPGSVTMSDAHCQTCELEFAEPHKIDRSLSGPAVSSPRGSPASLLPDAHVADWGSNTWGASGERQFRTPRKVGGPPPQGLGVLKSLCLQTPTTRAPSQLSAPSPAGGAGAEPPRSAEEGAEALKGGEEPKDQRTPSRSSAAQALLTSQQAPSENIATPTAALSTSAHLEPIEPLRDMPWLVRRDLASKRQRRPIL